MREPGKVDALGQQAVGFWAFETSIAYDMLGLRTDDVGPSTARRTERSLTRVDRPRRTAPLGASRWKADGVRMSVADDVFIVAVMAVPASLREDSRSCTCDEPTTL